ncbi:MAG TPA: NADH-quinone oxidoreductase subunit L [Limnochordales bacterium]
MAPAAPLAASLILAAFGRRLSARAVAWTAVTAVGVAAAAVAGAVAVYLSGGLLRLAPAGWWWQPGSQAPGLGVGLQGDGLSLWFALIVTGVGFLIHVYSVGYMAGDPGFARYFAELTYFLFAMLLLVLADGLMGMLLGWANVGLASYLLIGFWHHRPDARAASMKAFLVTLTGEVGIVLASGMLWGAAGTLRFAELAERAGGLSREVAVAAGLLLLWAAAAKSAQLPLHVWLPDAMAGPTPVSALIHAATMVTAGVYLTARMHPLYAAVPQASLAVAWVGAASCLFGAVVACGQTDIKRVLAYSTMSQVGYMLMGVGLLAQMAGLFHFFTQAFFKALLFLAAGLVIHRLQGEQDLTRMGGLARSMPLAYWATWAGALAMAGIPPFSGYFSKEAVLEAAWSRGQTGLWAAGTLAAGLTGFYSFRLLALAFLGPGRGPGGSRGVQQAATAAGHHEEPAVLRRAMEVPVAVLAVLSAVGGLAWVPGRTGWVPRMLEPVFGTTAAHGPAGEAHGAAGAVGWLPVALAAAGACLALYLYGPGARAAGRRWRAPAGLQRALAEGLYVDLAYRRTVVEAVVHLGAWLERVAETVWIDGSVRGVGALAALLSSLLGRAQAGPVRRYALGLLAGGAAVVAWAVWSTWSAG